MGERDEWPTLVLLIATYGLWGVAVFWVSGWSLGVALVLTALAITQHASLQHEVIHGHPFKNATLNAALVRPALSLVIPFGRFRDTHLAHHKDANLTDPYDDPETNFLAQSDWAKLSASMRGVLRFNNTLAGRMLVGPLIGQLAFMRGDWRGRNADVVRSWLAHLLAVALVVMLIGMSSMPLWAYAIAVYLALSVLKIRTFLEHRAHEASRARTVIVEDRGLLALLFLNNNFHAVHHMHPNVAWHALPRLYREKRARFLECNENYQYRSYGAVFRRYFWRAKDPVAHPLLRRARAKVDA